MVTKKRGQVSFTKTPAAVIEGIRKARHDYLAMAGEVDRWPEYWVTTYVAKALWKHFGKNGFITVESQAKSVLTRKRGWQSKKIRGTLKYDIGLWKKNESARAIIEIKHQSSTKGIVHDAKRVASALGGGKKMEFGAVGYYYCYDKSGKGKNPREELRRYHETVLADTEKALKGTKCHVTKESMLKSAYCMPYDKDDFWIAGCLTIKRKAGVRKK